MLRLCENVRSKYSPVNVMIEVIVWRIHDKSSEADIEGKEGLGNGIVPHLQKNWNFGEMKVILRINWLLDSVHRSESQGLENTACWNLDVSFFRWGKENTYPIGSFWKSWSQLEDRNRSISRNVMFSSYLELWTSDKVHKRRDSQCYSPSLEPCGLYYKEEFILSFVRLLYN